MLSFVSKFQCCSLKGSHQEILHVPVSQPRGWAMLRLKYTKLTRREGTLTFLRLKCVITAIWELGIMLFAASLLCGISKTEHRFHSFVIHLLSANFSSAQTPFFPPCSVVILSYRFTPTFGHWPMFSCPSLCFPSGPAAQFYHRIR